jgi:opacity protein-like surface antigen
MLIMGLIIILNPYFLCSQTLKDQQVYFNENKRFSIQLFATYVSSAELQDNIASEISFIRDASIEMSGGYGYGAEITYDPAISNFDVLFYLSTEYLKAKDDDLKLNLENDSAFSNVRFTEEYKIFPIEGGLKWRLPVSSERLKVFIGGGAGVYFGARNRSLGPYKSSNVSKKPGYSMNIMAGLEYFFERNLSVNFEFKFREASFESEDTFPVDLITVNGNIFRIQNPINSRIMADGTRISAGLKYNF